jgi:carboxylesterase type B
MGGTALSGKTDAGALEAYFGTEWRNLVGGYNMDDRKEILIQAHAHCFANQHGKHRQAFERRSTPPGYWRTDFPTTQEQKDDHAIADERERKAVEERYREAMRTGGRWKFRDE